MVGMTTAAEVREALEKHWKPAEYLVLHECAQDAMRQGRKIDTLVVSLWKSRGYELDAIEIKVSVSDWMKEVNSPEKADWWWHHSHRFWVAVPEKIAARVQETLPTGWGLLSVTDKGVKGVVKPTKHAATPLPWEAIVGIMRGASGAGANALVREHEKGRQIGIEQAQRTAAMESPARGDEALRARVAHFEEITGLTLGDHHWQTARLGDLVRLATVWENDPGRAVTNMRNAAKQLQGHVDGLEVLAVQLETSPERP